MVILGIENIDLKFKQNKDLDQWVGYLDSNFASDLDKRCSTIGYS